MDAVTSAYRSRKRPLNREPPSKAKRRLFPADVPVANRPAAKVQRRSLDRRRLLLVQLASLAFATAVIAYCLDASSRGCSDEELAPLLESLGGLADVGAPVQDEADSGHVE